MPTRPTRPQAPGAHSGRFPRAAWIALLALALLGGPIRQAAAVPDAYVDVVPAQRADVRARTDGELSRYRLDAALDPAAGTLAGTAAVDFRNDAPAPLNEVYFRLFPNAGYYGDGSLEVTNARVDGAAVSPALEVAETALRVPLPAPLVPGGTARIDLDFVTTVPADSRGSFGIFSRDTAAGTWVLADWHPVLAVYDAGSGWRLDPPSAAGDPTYAASAFYDVTLRVPENLTVVASGAEAGESTGDGLVERRYVAGPAREFTLVVDDDYRATSREVDGTKITVYTEPVAAAAAVARTLDVTTAALGAFGERFGPYPYTELDLVEVRLNQALAVSWSGIIFLDGPSLLGSYAANDPTGFETTVAHEVSHLWWGAVVGSDSNRHTFVNEGLATLSSIFYQEWTAGEATAEDQLRVWVVRPVEALLEHGDAVVDLPIAEGQDDTVRSWAAYGKGALGFVAIRERIGDAAFWDGLRAYADRYRFGIAEPADLRAAWERASGADLGPLWSEWFERADLSAAEIDAVVAAFAKP